MEPERQSAPENRQEDRQLGRGGGHQSAVSHRWSHLFSLSNTHGLVSAQGQRSPTRFPVDNTHHVHEPF